MARDCPNCSIGVIKGYEEAKGFKECTQCRYNRAMEEKRDALHKSLQRANERTKML